ncbi:alpha/beta hydrolase [Stenotrophobium rhamnosiphilum]|uniref:Alpha/beta hydrolase n=1 Tax=Stenotrophobium rhamnosiphilum TaxID=2029166 RepID=A0A2T5MJA9_9GAMM|nr:alpha/beta hydrolase [Stenotrophobium rhamnosiphilum]PTU32667.1 alpha/beta hydrolase [Stenotrophobium rhamnosiphilum]
MRKSFLWFVPLISALLLLSGCTGLGAINSLTSNEGYHVTSNLQYDRVTGEALDVYNFPQAQNAPVVVFFYGGRWTTGTKEEYKFVGQALTAQGFVVVIADYRKYPQVRFPAFVQDGAKAVKWTRENVQKFGGDPSKIFVMGHSSGAHIAAMLALNDSYLKAVGGNRSWLKGMIGLAGPYDFMPLTAPDMRDMFGPSDRYEQSQPILFVDGQNPPMLLLAAEDDEVVLIKNTRNLSRAVAKAGGPVETLTYPKVSCPAFNSHSCILATISTPLRKQSDVLAGISEFIKRRASGVGAVAPILPNAVQTIPENQAIPVNQAPLIVEDMPPVGEPTPVTP